MPTERKRKRKVKETASRKKKRLKEGHRWELLKEEIRKAVRGTLKISNDLAQIIAGFVMKVEYFEKKSNNQASHIIGAPLYVLHKKNIWNPHWEKVELRQNSKGEYSFCGTLMLESKRARDLLVSGCIEFPTNTTFLDLRNARLMSSIEKGGCFCFPEKLQKVVVSTFSEAIPLNVVQQRTKHVEWERLHNGGWIRRIQRTIKVYNEVHDLAVDHDFEFSHLFGY